MVGRLVAMLPLWCAVALCQPECKLYSSITLGELTLATAIAPGGLAAEADAVRCWERLTSQAVTPIRNLRLLMHEEEADLAAYRDKPEEVTSWASWLKMLADAPIPRGAMAEVVQTEAGVALRYRSEDGVVSKQVIRGRDPTLLRAGQSTFEIIYMIFAGPAPAFKNKPGGGMRLDLFLVSQGPLREADALRVMRRLSRDLQISWMISDVREDPFFIRSRSFPILHPLICMPPLLTEEQFLAGREMGCVVEYGKSSCLILWPASRNAK